MEYEARWIMHALKQGWPIDNFEKFMIDTQEKQEATPQEIEEIELHNQNWRNIKADILKFVDTIDPLTTSFDALQPYLHHFPNSRDAGIVRYVFDVLGMTDYAR